MFCRSSRAMYRAALASTMPRYTAATGAAAGNTASHQNPSSTASTKTEEKGQGTADTLQHSHHEEAAQPSSMAANDGIAPEPVEMYRPPPFFLKGRRGHSAPMYYVTRSNAGHPDPVAELVSGGRSDPEWMLLKLLCFFCTMATFGTTLYGYFFAEHVKYFKDEPWSPFTY